MAGLNNDNNPFQSQVRLGPQYVQLVPGPPGPPGSGSLTIESNDGIITQRPILDLVGLTYTDTGTAMRFAVPQPGFGTPVSSVAGVGALGVGQFWGLFIAGDVWTFPQTPLVGVEILMMHDTIRSLATIASGVTFQRFSGTSYTIEQPDGHLSGGVPVVASSVLGFTDRARYRWAFDGGSPGVYRCVSSLNSP
jgi:hypothetical protein